jgi:hypothetical protein
MKKNHVHSVKFFARKFFLLVAASCQIAYAQLPPQSPSYKRTGRTTIEIAWLAPNSDQTYPLYDLSDWIPQSFFLARSAGSRMQDCVISDGKSIYTSSVSVNEGDGKFNRFDLQGNFIESFTISGIPVIYKMAYDGKYFYAIQYNKPGIYCLDMEKRELVSIIPTPVNETYHICYISDLDNGKGGFEVGDNARGYFLRKDGTLLGAGPVYSNSEQTGCSATAYFNGILYAFCQQTSSLRVIVEFDMETLLPTGNQLNLAALIGQPGITESQMADDLNFFESPDGTMNALVSFYYSTTAEVGTSVTLFEIGKRSLPVGLQGYNVYQNQVKQNKSLLPASVYTCKSEGLNEETNYTYQITAVYNGEESPKSQTLTVRLPDSRQLPLVEDFSSGDLESNYWEVTVPSSSSPVWNVVNTPENLGERLPSLVFTYRYSRDYNQTIVSKPLKSDIAPVKLRYDVACDAQDVENEKLTIDVLFDDTWHTLATENSSTISGWKTKELTISQLMPGKTFQLRFSVSGRGKTTAYYWYLDNIRVWAPEYIRWAGIVRTIDMPLAEANIQLVKTDDHAITYETISDENGNFIFSNVEKGIYRLSISKAGKELYAHSAYQIELPDNQAQLTIPGACIEIDASPLNIVLNKNKDRNVRLPIFNNGNVVLDWDTEIQYKALGSGNELGQNTIPGMPAWEAVSGFDLSTPFETSLVLHKNHYYTLGDRKYEPPTYALREYSLNGDLTNIYIIATSGGYISGLVSDGEMLYEIKVTVDNGSLSPSIPGQLIPVDLENRKEIESKAIVTRFEEISSLVHAVYDPLNDGFYVGSGHVFFRIDRTGKVQKTFTGIEGSYTRYMALDTFSEGGPYLWLFCNQNIAEWGNSFCQAAIMQFSLKTETMTDIIHPVMDLPGYETNLSASPGGFFASTALVPGYFVLGGAVVYANIVMNEKVSPFIYKMIPYENWISLQNKTGEVAPKASGELSLNFSSGSLEDGAEREASLFVRSNAQEQPVEISVRLSVDHSAEEQCYAPQEPVAVLTDRYQVRVTWSMPSEVMNVKGYKIFRNGKLICEITLADQSFIDTIPGMGKQTYTVRALYETGCESYDSEPADIFVNNPEIVAPVGRLTASVVNRKHALLKWNTPLYGTGFFDDFESYQAFAVQDLGNWKLIDGDKSWTYCDASISYPNQRTPKAFMVFNPSACSPASTIMTYDNKKQFLACFSANVDKLSNDDWLISPRLNFNRPYTFSFMAKTHDLQYGYEKINIGYSLTGNDPENFIFVNGKTPVNVSNLWWKYEYSIPAEAKYVAINCVTVNGFILFIDDIYIGHPEYYSNLLGYNIYRNGKKQNTKLLQSNTYSDLNPGNGTYTYEVESLFANGTSSKTAAQPLIIDYTFEATPPRELQAERENNQIRLSWLVPSSIDRKAVRYCDSIPYNSIGGIEEEQMIGVRWEGADLDAYLGYTITGVRFHISDPVLYVVPFLYEDGELAAGGEAIQAEPGKYTTFLFDTPVTIRPQTEYIIGYSYLTPDASYYPVSHDKGPGIHGKSDLVSLNGYNWYSAYLLWGEEYDVNWNIAMMIDWDTEGEFEGYNLYRNNTKVNSKPMKELNYADRDDESAKEYYVSAVYHTQGEKESNRVVVSALGIDNVVHSFVTIYPNPAKDKLFVDGAFDSLELFSLDGKEICSVSFRGETVTEIDVRQLISGIYLLNVKNKGFTKHYKVIINNER